MVGVLMHQLIPCIRSENEIDSFLFFLVMVLSSTFLNV